MNWVKDFDTKVEISLPTRNLTYNVQSGKAKINFIKIGQFHNHE